MNKLIKFIVLLIYCYLLLFHSCLLCAQNELDRIKSEECFSEIKSNTAKFNDLWGIDLYAPILIINRDNRQIYANESDDNGILEPDGNIFTGVLPMNISFANTAIDWNGKRWTMIMEIPEDKNNRLDLLSHELFHYHQPKLGFDMANSENKHLDQKDGRIYLRLELKALLMAYNADNEKAQEYHLTNAFSFRDYRHELYCAAKNNENLLELNEGLASYTGIFMSGRDDVNMGKYFEKALDDFLNNPSFVRSFAYITVPLYGYILKNVDIYWNKKVDNETNLTEFFKVAFGTKSPKKLIKSILKEREQYDYDGIYEEETNREKLMLKIIADYKSLFVEQAHLVIDFEQMQLAFDPGNIVSLENYGSVYPSVRITDNWGVLTVQEGALLSSDWSNVIVSDPIDVDQHKVTGRGYVLELNDGYMVVRTSDGNYLLEKLSL